MNKSQEEMLHRHMTLFLSGDFDGLQRELFSVAFMSSAIDLMTEEDMQKAQEMTRKRMTAMMKELSDAAKEHIQNAERGGNH